MIRRLAVVLALAAVAEAQLCGDGIECPRNLCCDKHGHCGMGEDYCDMAECTSGAFYKFDHVYNLCGSLNVLITPPPELAALMISHN
jgi:hypothetical protein